MTVVAEAPPALAITVALCWLLTPEYTALNPALVEPAETVAVAGTDIAELLL
jgi:hypothetical protein